MMGHLCTGEAEPIVMNLKLLLLLLLLLGLAWLLYSSQQRLLQSTLSVMQ